MDEDYYLGKPNFDLLTWLRKGALKNPYFYINPGGRSLGSKCCKQNYNWQSCAQLFLLSQACTNEALLFLGPHTTNNAGLILLRPNQHWYDKFGKAVQHKYSFQTGWGGTFDEAALELLRKAVSEEQACPRSINQCFRVVTARASRLIANSRACCG